MKVSLNLAQDYSNVDLKSISHDELLKSVGAQLGAVEDTKDWKSKFKGAVIVKVVSCEKHSNADKLSVCRIDDGGRNNSVERDEDGLVQVVCGAPNVRAGIYAIWLAPGVVVPSTLNTDPFILESRDIRGVVSNGMLASAQELGISDDHTGIVELTEADFEAMPVEGSPLADHFGLDDFVIDCENKMFTHRPDCFGNLGVARELAGINGLDFKSPDWYINKPIFEEKNDIQLAVGNDIQHLVPRFMTVALSNTTVSKSPFWLETALVRVGIKPVNNIVDVTNYVMHLTGQPLHAFDYDKVKELSTTAGLHPRLSQAGETINLLGQKGIVLTGEEIVISTDKQAVALAGVMGGADTEVDEHTKNIIIECATFDMYSIRRTSMRHGLFTDAVTRFNKGQSPLQTDRVLAYAMKMMSELTGAIQASPVYDMTDPDKVDINHDGWKSGYVNVAAEFVNQRLGTSFSNEDLKSILEKVEFKVEEVDGKLKIHAPFWRMDINIPEDIVEEVGRLYGYNKIPVSLPIRSAKPAAKNQLQDFKMQLREHLKERGANEVLTYSFVHGELLRKTGIDADRWSYHIRNAISPELQYYRPSLIPSLLSKVHANIKAQAGSLDNQFALFEIGKSHLKSDSGELPMQLHRLGLVIAADNKTAKSKQHGAAYYLALKYLKSIASNISLLPLEDSDDPLTSPFEPGRSATVVIEDQVLGVIGEFKPSVRKSLKLPEFSAGFEVDVEVLHKYKTARKYQPLPPLPGTSQDYTHEVSGDITWESVKAKLTAGLKDVQAKGYKTSVEPISVFKDTHTDNRRFTFRINFSHPSKTMTTEEAKGLLDEAVKSINFND